MPIGPQLVARASLPALPPEAAWVAALSSARKHLPALPAVGQGALGLQTRAADARTRELLAPLQDAATRASVDAERTLLATLSGGCLAPVGAWGRVEENILHLSAVVLSADGVTRLLESGRGDPRAASDLGQRVAAALLARGAAELIGQCRATG